MFDEHLQQFHSFGFRVSALILDGASSNLSMIKLLMGVKGVFGHDNHQDDCHRISPCIRNPFTGELSLSSGKQLTSTALTTVLFIAQYL